MHTYSRLWHKLNPLFINLHTLLQRFAEVVVVWTESITRYANRCSDWLWTADWDWRLRAPGMRRRPPLMSVCRDVCGVWATARSVCESLWSEVTTQITMGLTMHRRPTCNWIEWELLGNSQGFFCDISYRAMEVKKGILHCIRFLSPQWHFISGMGWLYFRERVREYLFAPTLFFPLEEWLNGETLMWHYTGP